MSSHEHRVLNLTQMIQIIYNKSVNVIVRKFKTLNKIDSQRGKMDLKIN